jgi:CxxC-x17-CxxC domain-containing protein
LEIPINREELKMAYGNGGYRDRDAPREFFKATCSDCGQECEVPFKPTQGRPVYCRDCFKKHQPEDRRSRY